MHRFSSGDCRLIVPDLFCSEIGNILRKAVRRGRLSAASNAAALDGLEHLGIATFPSLPLLKDAMTIALAFDRTVYEFVYVALAVESATSLVTADDRLAATLAARLPVRWLGAVPL